jgi:gas vesicle protein
MADGYDRFDNESGGGGSFVIGLLTGTVLGAGLGMLFAPKAGSDLRNQLSEQAGNLANSASEGYRKATGAAGEWADRGRDMVDKAKDAAMRGADEAQRYVRDTANNIGSSLSSSSAPAPASSSASSAYPSSAESIRGSQPSSMPSTGSSGSTGGSYPGSGSGPTGGGPRRS